MRKKSPHPLQTVGVWLLAAACAVAADWPRFRGPQGDGKALDANPPVTWDTEKNVAWKAELPGPGNSSPIVQANRVYVTSSHHEGHTRSLLCFDRDSGDLLWQRDVQYAGEELTHDTNPQCGSTPAADAERVVVWHGSAGLHCYDHAGELQWSRDLGEFRHIWGYGSSPIWYQQSVILYGGPGSQTFLAAFDRDTGETLWRIDEPGSDSGEDRPDGEKPVWRGSWSTPVLRQHAGRDELILSQPDHVRAYDPRDGAVLWSCPGLSDLVYTSPVVQGSVIVCMSGYHGPALAVNINGAASGETHEPVWRLGDRQPQRIGSGVLLEDALYMANEDGTFQCIDVTTGQDLWKARLTGSRVWGSLVLAGGRLYVTDQKGTTHVIAPNDEELQVLSTNPLEEPSNSTPAIVGKEIFVRTMEHLYCIRE